VTFITALSTPASVPAFNGTFYTVAVSVIPVLYLGIAVQGDLYSNLMSMGWRAVVNLASHWTPAKADVPKSDKRERTFRFAIVPTLVGLIAVGILFFGIIGEILGLLSLYWQRVVGFGWLPFLATAFLLIVTAGGPIAVLLKPARGIIPVLYFASGEDLEEVVSIIVSSGRVLLARDEAGWKFPTGHILRRETYAAAAVRNVAAVAKLRVSVQRGLGQYWDSGKFRMIQYVACTPEFYDVFSLDEEEISPGKGIAELSWCPFSELMTKIPHPIFGPVHRYLEENLRP
jgi:8-oxo-dGTP diphosphatase